MPDKHTSAKLVTLKRALELREKARAQGKSVVVTNGCFDLLHVGHVRYLTAAAAEGDFMFVALNSDRSVRALKGVSRPLFPVSDRAEIISAFECVDRVIIFDDPTADHLLEQLRPDVHAKGTDYTAETVPERETVQDYGGRIAIVGDPKDRSSAGLLQRIGGRIGGAQPGKRKP